MKGQLIMEGHFCEFFRLFAIKSSEYHLGGKFFVNNITALQVSDEDSFKFDAVIAKKNLLIVCSLFEYFILRTRSTFILGNTLPCLLLKMGMDFHF